MNKTNKIPYYIFFLVLMSCGCISARNEINYSSTVGTETEAANIANKKEHDLSTPDLSQTKRWLASQNYDALEEHYAGLLTLYEKDVIYETPLHIEYFLFGGATDISIADIDRWIDAKHSASSYAARGMYRATKGYEARGHEYIDKTPDHKIQEMLLHHKQAADDLLRALNLNPKIMPLYARLIDIARASPISLSTEEILQRAAAVDKKNFYVRFHYILSLQPRWGGSYEAMDAFSKSMRAYANLNPRLWSLQGEASADRGQLALIARNCPSAIDAYTDALRFGDRVTWLIARGLCYEELSNRDAAIEDFKKVLYYDPKDRRAQEGLKRLKRI